MIVFEGLSLARFLACLPQVRKSRVIYVLDHDALDHKAGDYERVIEQCRRLVPGLEVRIVRHSDFPDLVYESNRVLVDIVESQAPRLAASAGARLVTRLYPGRGAVVALQRALLEHLRRSVHFATVTKQLSAGATGPVLMVPEAPDLHGVVTRVGGGRIPLAIRLLGAVTVLKHLLRAPAYLAASVLAGTRRPVRSLPPPLETDFGIHVMWPVNSGAEIRRNDDCFFLEDGDPGFSARTLYCFGAWALSSAEDAATRAAIEARGGHHCDIYAPSPTWAHIWCHNILAVGLGSVRPLLAGLLAGPRAWLELDWGLRAIRLAIQWENFCLHYRPKVFIGYDDQRISHVARTMVFERYGLVSAGLHHPSFCGLAALPDTAFLHFHLRFVYGPEMRQDYAPFWDMTPFVDVGPFRADLISRAEENQAVRDAFRSKYGGKTTILVGLPNARIPPNLPWRFDEFCTGLADLARRNPDIHFLLRPRSAFDPPPTGRKVLDDLVTAGRATFETRDFNTFQLAAFADLTISPTSSMAQEVIHAGRKVIVFCFNGVDGRHRYARSTPRVATWNGAELREMVEWALKEDSGAWDGLRAGVVGDNHGRVVAAIRNCMERLLDGSPADVAAAGKGTA